MRKTGLAAAAVLLSTLTVGCGEEDRFAVYCDEVKAQQRAVTEALAAGDTALLQALPSFQKLAKKAPDDIKDEWAIVTDRIEALDEALDDADIDPTDYDRDKPPASLSAEDKAAIDEAAAGLALPDMAEAFAGVQQQARDVCKTPLSR